MSQTISLVVAASTNHVIGNQGDLPWRLGDDLKHFKRLTMGKPIVMGRLTWESIGRALPGRQNIVITRQRGYVAEGADVVASPEEALEAVQRADEIMVIGGAQIYALFLPRADRIYLTRVHAEIVGDAYFRIPDNGAWKISTTCQVAASDVNEYDFELQVLERVEPQSTGGADDANLPP